ncbi:TonB-dependent receptor [candidate division KSB1 bacterium]|nr:TonB-dependent receptor [candidate division KSB1 bacterium]
MGNSPGEWDKAEYAVFFHDEQILLRKLIFTFGARYNQDEIAGSEFCPQAGLVFHPRGGTILRGAVNKGFRSPQINELYLFPPSNTDLKPEKVWNYEVGLNQRILAGVDIDIVGYLIKGEDLIQKETNPNPPPMYKFRNTGEFDFRGIEAGLKAQIGAGLSVRIYYTYLDPGEKTRGRPGDKVDFALRYARRKLALSLTAQYVADYFAEDNWGEPISDYLVINAKLNYKIVPGFRVFLAVDNFLNRDYAIYVDLPGGSAGVYTMPGRAVTGGVSFSF